VRKWRRVDTADGPRLRAALESHESALLHNMAGSIIGMLDDRESSSPTDELEQITGLRTGHSQPPPDATMARLLPDFFSSQASQPADSDQADSINGALRSLHEPEIIDAKREAAQRLLDTCPIGGGRLELTEDDAGAWLSALNDIRLALGTMLDVGPDGPDRLPAGHPMAGHLDVYQWLTVLQEYLVLALMDRPGR
jgi:Domain of unknown function (DUF2017)